MPNDDFNEERPDWEPEYNGRDEDLIPFNMVDYAHRVCGFPSKHGRSMDDPTIDLYEERLIEERRAG